MGLRSASSRARAERLLLPDVRSCPGVPPLSVEGDRVTAATVDRCACGESFDAHPTDECSTAHAVYEFEAFGHALRVAEHFERGSHAWWVGIFHDFAEDCIGGVPAPFEESVVVLTRNPDEPYKDYIERVRTSGDSYAIAVKLADARDNLARCEGHFDGQVNPRLADRYRYVIEALS